MNNKTFDIAVAPLVDNEFKHGKSSQKYMEYSAMVAAGVYAKLETTKRSFPMEKTAILPPTLKIASHA